MCNINTFIKMKGLLEVNIPKSEATKPKLIEVKVK